MGNAMPPRDPNDDDSSMIQTYGQLRPIQDPKLHGGTEYSVPRTRIDVAIGLAARTDPGRSRGREWWLRSGRFVVGSFTDDVQAPKAGEGRRTP